MSEEQMHAGDHDTDAAGPVVDDETEAHRSHERHVPLDALQAERQERQKLQDELQMMKEHIALISAQKAQSSQSKDEMESLSDDDVLTVGEAKRYLQKMNSQYEMSLQELKISQKYPDYQEVVTKYLPEVLKQNPDLRSSLQKTQDYELAYYLAKNSDSFKQNHKKAKKNEDAERIIQNSQRSGSLSAVGQTSPISQAKRFKDMPDEEFKKMVNKNLGYF